MNKPHNWDNWMHVMQILAHKMYVGPWFHGPVILSHLEDYLMEKCCTEDIDSV